MQNTDINTTTTLLSNETSTQAMQPERKLHKSVANRESSPKSKGLIHTLNRLVFAVCHKIGLVKINRNQADIFTAGQHKPISLSMEGDYALDTRQEDKIVTEEFRRVLLQMAYQEFMTMDLSQTVKH